MVLLREKSEHIESVGGVNRRLDEADQVVIGKIRKG